MVYIVIRNTMLNQKTKKYDKTITTINLNQDLTLNIFIVQK